MIFSGWTPGSEMPDGNYRTDSINKTGRHSPGVAEMRHFYIHATPNPPEVGGAAVQALRQGQGGAGGRVARRVSRGGNR